MNTGSIITRWVALMIQLEKFVGGGVVVWWGGGVVGWLTPTTYIQLAGAGSICCVYKVVCFLNVINNINSCNIDTEFNVAFQLEKNIICDQGQECSKTLTNLLGTVAVSKCTKMTTRPAVAASTRVVGAAPTSLVGVAYYS